MKEFLIDQFASCYDENVWFVALKNALEGITAEEAAWSPSGSDRSVWKLLTHLNYYNDSWLIRFRGGEFTHAEGMTNDDTFVVPDAPDEAMLAAELVRMAAIMDGWRTALRNADEAKFAAAVSATNDTPWRSIISDINTHTAYHAGQILLLRKLRGSWDTSKGVS
jgi:uncharacterized damage-inducible protein DinB